jgi:hypothetical protein
MLLDPKREERLDRLTEELRRAPAPSPSHFSRVIADACTRLPLLNRTAGAVRMDQLIKVGAWSDAALALIELELPAWHLRRLVYEDGEWVCSLSRHPHLPAAFDNTVDATHTALPLAILGAFLAARSMIDAAREANSSAAPRVQPTTGDVVCCDNFA